MAVVLGQQSALRVWDNVVAGGNRCARVDWNAPVNRDMSPDQRIHVTPNMPAASQGVTAADQSVSFAFQDARDYRRTLERDTKAAVKFLESAVAPELAPAVRDRFFSDESLIHTTVAHARLRRAGGGIETSVRKGPFHPRSFMRIEDGLYVSTPEMAFCEMASVLSLERLIALGFELCGTYRRASTFGLARYDATPLTSPSALASFVEKSPPVQRCEESSSSTSLHSCRLCFAARKRACHAIVPSLFARRLWFAAPHNECGNAAFEKCGRDGALVAAL